MAGVKSKYVDWAGGRGYNSARLSGAEKMRFFKYQALGNAYVILESVEAAGVSASLVRRLCDHRYGLGSDGVLVPSFDPHSGEVGLRIFNPDGSEAEKSGNGLRILARYLWEQHRVGDAPFTVTTAGGPVRCQVRDDGRMVLVEMGRASFASSDIPVKGRPREVVDEQIEIDGAPIRFAAVTVGNPHCVVPVAKVSRDLAVRLGPLLEQCELFPQRTNVQFLELLGPHRIRIEVWERGAGYTLSSGSGSCAAAAAAVRLGLCQSPVTVVMPGGELEIGVHSDYHLTMLGPAHKIAEGELAGEFLEKA